MKKYDIIVIGAGPAGMVTAMTARKQYGDKTILLITAAQKGMVPCGIPYVFHDLEDLDKNVSGPKPFADMGGELLIGDVTRVDIEQHVLTVGDDTEVGFEKLVFATGSAPFKPTFIPGHDLTEGVGYVPKSYSGIAALKQQTDKASSIIILGSGFTAVEMAEQLAQEPGKEVKLVYRAAHCLLQSFSADNAQRVDDALVRAGVHLHAKSQIGKILSEGNKATGIELDTGETMKADLVIIAMGYRSSSELAKAAGLAVNKQGAIIVDNYLRTDAKDVFAVGDCAGTECFITGRDSQIMLASTGAAEARILGHNLYAMRIMRNFPGTLSVFSTELSGVALASAGVIEPEARAAGIDIVIGEFQDVDRHPGSMPGVSPMGIRLVVSSGDGQIIGGELFGSASVSEMVNTLAMAIQKNVTVYELISFQLGTHPKLTTAPTKPLLIKAAEHALSQLQA